MLNQLWPVIIASLSPISELRGGIPIGVGLGLPFETVFITAVVANCLVFFGVFLGLEILYKGFFHRFKVIRNLLENIRKRGEKKVKRYGIWSLFAFVAVPLPITGAWTGTALAWIFKLEWKRSFAVICAGVLTAGIIVSLFVLGILALV